MTDNNDSIVLDSSHSTQISLEAIRAVQYPISWNRTVSFDSNILGWYTLSLKRGLFNGGVLIHAKKAYPDCFV